MKRIFLFAIATTILFSCSEKKNVEISGKIDKGNGKTIYLIESTTKGDIIVDSTILNQKSTFLFKQNIEQQKFYKLNSETESILLLAKPNDKIVVNTNISDLTTNASISGSSESEKYLSLVKELKNTEKTISELKEKHNQLLLSENYSTDIKNDIEKEYLKAKILYRNKAAKYIQDNPTSLTSILVVYQKFSDGKYILNKEIDLPFIKIACDSLTKHFPKNSRVELLVKDYNNMTKTAESIAFNEFIQASESSLPELLLPNTEGKEISLRGLKGKVVILNFWSYTNKESVANNLVLKSLYKEYNSRGLEIYSVSLDRNREEWKKAVNFDQLPWINVIDTNYPETIQTRTYNVTQVPTFYLINRDNEIIGRDLSLKRLKIRIEHQL